MDLNDKIEELKEELISQRGFLWSKKNKDSITKCLNIIEDIKLNLPSALQEAGYILSQKQKILSSAQEAGNKIVADATMKAKQLLSEEKIYKEAQAEVENMVADANKRCNQLYSSTKENIDRMLKSVEDYFADNLHVIRNNREELAGGNIINKRPKQ
ncbi:MAG: hypothetical protein IJT25_01175 [Clostridia bacterium]|nr:hypothetical protein [Clostridia bacterium]